MNIPDYAKHRPLHKGMLVPFSVLWNAGIPDFKAVDPTRVYDCVTRRLCGVCGKIIGRKGVFIGGPSSMRNLLFTDPAMHAECARYAYSVCPFLFGKITEMSENYSASYTVDPNVNTTRPATYYTLTTTAWHFATYRDNVYIQANKGQIKEINS